MRPHHLRLTAFGAFPGTVELDLDALGAGGLVLLCGETGGGKTTLLDALGFALFGVVPGIRATAKDLRSHHAIDGDPTEVSLEFSVGPSRFRVTRKPPYDRPAKRGEGTTRTQPAALLERQIDATTWEPVAQRMDDVGHEISHLVGMTAEQFFQVILLPQGRFADFLHSDHDSREKLLKQLFHVDRFEFTERWLADRAHVAADALRDARQELAQVTGIVAQVAGAEPPADPEATPDWAATLTAAAERSRADAAARTDTLDMIRRDAEALLADERSLARRQDERRAADVHLRMLTDQQPEIDVLASEMDGATRAVPVRVAIEMATRRAAELDQVRQTELTAREAIRALGGQPGLEATAYAELGRVARTELGRLENLTETLAAADREDSIAARATTEADELARTVDRIGRQLTVDLPVERDRARARLLSAQAAAAQLPEVRERSRLAGELARAVREQRTAAAAAKTTAATAREARDRADAIRRQRFDAVTAELAAALDDDTPCPVCGSLTHPDPTEVRADHVSKDQELAAEADAVDAVAVAAERRREADRLDERAWGLRRQLENHAGISQWRDSANDAVRVSDVRPEDIRPDLARFVVPERVDTPAVAGRAPGGPATGDRTTGGRASGNEAAQDPEKLRRILASDPLVVDHLERHAADLAAHAADLAAANGERDEAERILALLVEEERRLTAEYAKAAADCGSARQRAQEARGRAGEHRAVLLRELGEGVSLGERRRRVTALADAFEFATDAITAAVTAGIEHGRALEAAADQAASAGFAGIEAAAQAGRDNAWLADTRVRLDRHRDDLAAIRARLASEDLDVAVEPRAAVGERAAAAEEARKAHESAVADVRLADDLARQLADLGPRFANALAALAPLRTAADELRALADIAAGRGDNRLGMPLSSFVLAARLEQVAAAASLRLAQMTGERFTLVYDDGQRRDKRRRAGLGLLVDDAWTNRRRDTATLSGGETFQAALALALGLADVVTAEAGGQAIDALFVDEGFGSLDPDSLEEVMNVLDDLRSGGRLVGVVSHVAELRQRIPTQVHVIKGVTGSTVQTTT